MNTRFPAETEKQYDVLMYGPTPFLKGPLPLPSALKWCALKWCVPLPIIRFLDVENSLRHDNPMRAYRFTDYFENKVLENRPYLTKQMCIDVVESPLRREEQADGERVRFWGHVEALGGRSLRVITLADEVTIHNAFPDRRFKP